jgi:hypothetical protein
MTGFTGNEIGKRSGARVRNHRLRPLRRRCGGDEHIAENRGRHGQEETDQEFRKGPDALHLWTTWYGGGGFRRIRGFFDCRYRHVRNRIICPSVCIELLKDLHVIKTISLSFDHTLPPAEALRRVRERCESAAKSGTVAFIEDDTHWREDGGEFAVKGLGMTFRGWLKVDDEHVELSLKLPTAARLIANRIAGIVEQEARFILQQPSLPEPSPLAAAPPLPPLRTRAGEGDAVIGAIYKYGWEEISVWANSLAETGFVGDRVLIAIDVAPECVERLGEAGFSVIQPRQEDRLRMNGGYAPFLVERFQHIADFLAVANYRHVILTDVRDVVFQANPSAWLEAHFEGRGLLTSSEGVRIGDEWWGSHMLENAFGTDALDAVRDRLSRNAGIIAGTREECLRICREIVRVCTQEHETGADQAAYNLILSEENWRHLATTVHHDVAWACQAGTVADPRQLPQLREALLDVAPVFDGAFVRTPGGEPYAIVHQYDRVPQWRDCFEARYK